MGEITIGGFTNQLFGIYSYIPVAEILNCSGVLVGPIYSRSSFEDPYRRYKEF